MVIMTDRDQAQINAIENVYPDSQTLLCLWHVLCALRSHFVTEQFQALWAKIKYWVKTEDTECHGLTSASGVVGTSGGTSGPRRWLIIAGMDCWQVFHVKDRCFAVVLNIGGHTLW